MKNVGIPRRLDELGRIVIPIDVRRALSLNERDTVMFFLDEKSRTVILKKEVPSCICCHAADSLRQLPGSMCAKAVLRSCPEKIQAPDRGFPQSGACVSSLSIAPVWAEGSAYRRGTPPDPSGPGACGAGSAPPSPPWCSPGQSPLHPSTTCSTAH